MSLSLSGILERDFYLLGVARSVYPSGQKTVMINFLEMNSKMVQQLTRDGKEEASIYSSAYTALEKTDVSPQHFAKSSRLSVA